LAADDSGISKTPVVNPQEALVHPQTQKQNNLLITRFNNNKKKPALIVNPQHNISESAFLVDVFAK
jgi:hypothetical protein